MDVTLFGGSNPKPELNVEELALQVVGCRGLSGLETAALRCIQCLGHFQVGSYRYRSLKEGLYTSEKPYRRPIYPKLSACSFL